MLLEFITRYSNPNPNFRIFDAHKRISALKNLITRPNLLMTVSFFSILGSLCWFSAMSLEIATKIATLIMVEVSFTILISIFLLKETVKKDYIALAFIGITRIFIIL